MPGTSAAAARIGLVAAAGNRARLRVARQVSGGGTPSGASGTATAATRPMSEEERHHILQQIADIHRRYQAELNGVHDAEQRRAIQARERDEVAPHIEELRRYRGARYNHPDRTVQQAVLAAVGLLAQGQAEWELTNQGAGGRDAEARARRAAGLPQGAWCGAFAFTQMNSAGLGRHLMSAMHSTGPGQGIDAAFTYQGARTHVWGGERWMPLREYHEQRGSVRHFLRIPDGHPGTGLDIQPGDIVLIDNARGTFADHITVCHSYDPQTGRLETIGGNEPNVRAGSRDLTQNPRAQTVEAGQRKQSRVYAVARPSIADYEELIYLPNAPRDLTRPPEQMPSGGVSPAAGGGGGGAAPAPSPAPSGGGGGAAGPTPGGGGGAPAPTPGGGRSQSTPSGPRPLLRRGTRGDAVRELQTLLTREAAGELEADGAFGSATETAVRTFQQARSLAVDGIVGPRTWGALQGGPSGTQSQPSSGGGAGSGPTPAGPSGPSATSDTAGTSGPAGTSGTEGGQSVDPDGRAPWSYVPEVDHSNQEGLNLSNSGAVQPVSRRAAAIARHFGFSGTIHGYGARPNNPNSDHPMGYGLDFMVGGNSALGDQVAGFFHQFRNELNVKYVIWNAQIASPRGGWAWRPYTHPSGQSNPTLDHRDHPHVSFRR